MAPDASHGAQNKVLAEFSMTLSEKLNLIDEQLLDGKRAISNALLFVGITAVEPNPNVPDKYEIFQSYADKIKRLMVSNSFIMEFVIPEENLTKYKRTLMLPMSSTMGILDNLALEIVASDTGYTPSSNTKQFAPLSTNKNDVFDELQTTDVFGNKVIDNEKLIRYSELSNFLLPDEINGMVQFLENEGVEVLNDSQPEPLADEDVPNFQFTVDWGDGTSSEFISLEETPDAWYHTYEKGGTYDVSINGFFRHPQNAANQRGNLVINGEIQYDKDGVEINSVHNYVMSSYLKKIIAWGNTKFNSLHQAFFSCYHLNSIPTYDTTNSFSDVESITSMFCSCYNLPEIPYDTNTKRGLFSNATKITQANSVFYNCTGLSSELPPLLFDGCTKIYTFKDCFYQCNKLKGSVPVDMFKGVSSLSDTSRMFFGVTNLSGEIPETLFNDTPLLTNAYLMFANTSVSGIIHKDLFKNNPKLYNVVGMFSNTDVSGVEPGLFDNIAASITETYFRAANMFQVTKITEINEGLFGNIPEDKKPYFEATRMFASCKSLTSITPTIFEEVSGLKNARDMFTECINITSQCPTEPSNGDWNSQDTIEKYYAMFGGCKNMPGFDTLPIEIGGMGERRVPTSNVGKILLSDRTLVEVKDYTYDVNNKPIALCFYTDENGKNYCMAFNETNNRFCIHTIFSNLYREGPFQVMEPDIYSDELKGEEFTNTWMSWSGYTNNKSSFPIFQYLENYLSDNTSNHWYLHDIPTLYRLFSSTGWFINMKQRFETLGMTDYSDSTCYAPSTMNWYQFVSSENYQLYSQTQYQPLMMRNVQQNSSYVNMFFRPCINV